MRKTVIIILLAVVILGGFLIFYQSRLTNQQIGSSQEWATKIDDQESVTVVITPLDLSAQSSEWKFDIGMNTHSVELDQDMTKVVTLTDDRGSEYTPLRWEGPVGGHHREGVLIFSKVATAPKSVELKIAGIGGVIRSFIWQLK